MSGEPPPSAPAVATAANATGTTAAAASGAPPATRLDGLTVAVAGAATMLRDALAEGLAAAGARTAALAPADSAAEAATLAEAARGAVGGRVRALVCAPPPLAAARFEDLSSAAFDAAVAASYRAPLLQTQALLGDLRGGGAAREEGPPASAAEGAPPARGASAGRAVYVTSATAILARAETAHVAAGARAAVALMRTLAVEEGPAVTANAIACGPMAGDALHAARARGLTAERGVAPGDAAAAVAERLPLGRLVAPGDVVEAVAWLLSPAAGAVTGQVVALAGGGELQVWP